MTSVSIGPMSFSMTVFTGIVILAIILLVSWAADRRYQTNTEAALWKVAFSSLILGRMGYVLKHLDTYRQQPIDILNIRDGGFSLTSAVVTAVALLLLIMWRQPATRKPLLLSMTAGVSAAGIFYTGYNLTRPDLPRVPDVTMLALDETPVQLSQFRGQPTVINLWATWCPPCRREMPALQAGQESNPDIHFVFANQRESKHLVETYLSQEGLALENVLLDQPGILAQEIASHGLPTTLFVDKEGRLIDFRLGELSAATLQDRLDALRSH